MKPTVITSGNAGESQPQVAANANGNINAQNQTGGEAHYQQPHGFPPNGRNFPGFQHGFGFDNDVDDMFSDVGLRSRLGRMRDPFGRFDAQFGNLGTRRRANPPADDDDDQFFGNIPTEFRHYIPDGFGFPNRRAGAGAGQQMPPRSHPQQVPGQQQQPQHVGSPKIYQTYVQTGSTPPPPAHQAASVPQSPTKVVCDAAIQTEDAGTDRVDAGSQLHQHGLRNTVDLGVKTPAEEEGRGPRSHSAPPQQDEANQTPPQQFQRAYYPPQAQPHPQQQQQPQPTTPGGSYIRTIPIFVEGRSEPIISKKEIPVQQQPQQPPKSQPARPTPLNTQNQIPVPGAGAQPPQTPHTVESINKIQNIQRDVLELMTSVEKFTGTRKDKEYAYLDEMLTRNLLKLDTIDTNGKESIRLARKEAIRCIQASINVLEAKAEGNAKTATATETTDTETQPEAETEQATPAEEETKTTNPEEPIPLPAPEAAKEPSPAPTPDEAKPKE